VPDGCSLILNIGTTTEAIARELMRHRGLRVITNNLNVASILSDHADCELIVAGGVVRRATAASSARPRWTSCASSRSTSR
jgi:DeoR family glycerol-3-phosphate regulon repressor